jgi:hypothetical protein
LTLQNQASARHSRVSWTISDTAEDGYEPSVLRHLAATRERPTVEISRGVDAEWMVGNALCLDVTYNLAANERDEAA